MSEIYSWEEFKIYMYYRTTAEELFSAWATASGLESFFIKEALFQSIEDEVRSKNEIVDVGDKYKWLFHHQFEVEGRVLAVEPYERFSFTFGKMIVDVKLKRKDDLIELELIQSKIPTDTDTDRAWSHMNCRSCWIYFLMNLKSVLQYGNDLRENEPELSDCVGIGFVPPKS